VVGSNKTKQAQWQSTSYHAMENICTNQINSGIKP